MFVYRNFRIYLFKFIFTRLFGPSLLNCSFSESNQIVDFKVRPQGDLYLTSTTNKKIAIDCFVPNLPYTHSLSVERRDKKGDWGNVGKPGAQLSINYDVFAMHRCRIDFPQSSSPLYSRLFLVNLKGEYFEL